MAGERLRPGFGLAALLLATTIAYLFGLSWAPIHPHFDEIRFAEQARSIAESGTDLNGRFLPVYFQMDGRVWFHPVGVYLPALAFKILPLSVFALRAPTVLVGVLNVLLIYLVALRLFRRRDLALLAGALLAITPAHFIHSRMAVDYLFPTPFVLAWTLLLLQFFESRRAGLVLAATSMLGVGVYSYIAAVALMPLLLMVTLGLLWVERAPWRMNVVAIAGFCWPLLPAVWFVAAHPEMLSATQGRYGLAALQLDAFQQLRETLTPWFLSDRANLYMSFFAPGYLFFSGGGSLVGSTRTAGVFLLPMLPLILVGFRALLLRFTPGSALVLAGVFVPPIAGSIVNEQFAVGRAIAMVPFVILMAVFGVQAWAAASAEPRVSRLLALGAGVLATVGVVYTIFRASGGSVSPGGVIVIAFAAVLIAIATVMGRAKRWWPVVAALLFACVVQSAIFTRDYFGDYRARSAYWFSGNLRGVVSRLVQAIDGSGARPVVLFERSIPIADWYWRFHLAEIGRSDLGPLAKLASVDEIGKETLPPGTLIVLPVDDYDALVTERRLELLATVMDPSDQYSTTAGADRPAYLIYQAR